MANADFNFYINRQGPQGQQGPKGNDGFSPVITVAQDDLAGYILRIQTSDADFLTTNLRATIDNLNGTYVRYNQETGKLSAAPADLANTTQVGEVRFATDEEVNSGAELVSVSPKNLQDYIDSLGVVNDVATLKTDVAGNTSNIAKNAMDIAANKTDIDTIKGNYVTTNTYQTINSTKVFTSKPYISEIGEASAGYTFLKVGKEEGNKTIEFGNYNFNANIQFKTSNNQRLIHTYDSQPPQYLVEENDFATTAKAGLVKPDGTSIGVDANGVIKVLNPSGYTLPQATATELGGVKAESKTEADNVEVRIDPETGKLFTQGGDISALLARIEELETRVTALETEINGGSSGDVNTPVARGAKSFTLLGIETDSVAGKAISTAEELKEENTTE